MPDQPLTEIEIAVIDAALAEEITEDLGILDDPSLLQRYRAEIIRRRQDGGGRPNE